MGKAEELKRIMEKKIYLHPLYIIPYRQVIEDLLSSALSKSGGELKILDAGSGTGLVSFLYAKLLDELGASADSRIVGLDIDRDSVSDANYLKQNPECLSECLRHGTDKKRISTKDPFFNGWVSKLDAGECEYFDSLNFIMGDAGDKSFMESLGDFDAVLFNESLHVLSPDARKNLVGRWNCNGPLVISTGYPKKYRSEIAEYSGEPLAFVVLDRRLHLDPKAFEYLPSELMLAVPTRGTDLPAGKDYVFDLVAYKGRSVFSTSKVCGFESDPTRNSYSYLDFNPDFVKADLPIEMMRDIGNVPRGSVTYNSGFMATGYCVRVETEDVVPDESKISLADGGINIGFSAPAGGRPGFYELSMRWESKNAPEEMISFVDRTAKKLYALENSRIGVVLK